jgi:hypothetical protein
MSVSLYCIARGSARIEYQAAFLRQNLDRRRSATATGIATNNEAASASLRFIEVSTKRRRETKAGRDWRRQTIPLSQLRCGMEFGFAELNF